MKQIMVAKATIKILFSPVTHLSFTPSIKSEPNQIKLFRVVKILLHVTGGKNEWTVGSAVKLRKN